MRDRKPATLSEARKYRYHKWAGLAYVLAWHDELFRASHLTAEERAKTAAACSAQLAAGRAPLWEFATIFGPELHMGGKAPDFFVNGTQIEIEVEERA